MKGYCLIAAFFLTAASASAQETWRDTTAKDTGGRLIFKESSFVQPVTPRDSILVADRLLYGFELDNVPDSTVLAFPAVANPFMQDVIALPRWQVDTVKVQKIRANNARLLNIRASIAIQPFEEGTYELPPLFVQRIHSDGSVDTIQFNRQTIEVFTMPVDTATYVPHDLRGQIRYPVTLEEVMPWLMGFWALALLVIGLVAWLRSRRRDADGPAFKEPAHITALRKLDKYRGDKFWAPDKQKQFYSGVTDALREYIVSSRPLTRRRSKRKRMPVRPALTERPAKSVMRGLTGHLKNGMKITCPGSLCISSIHICSGCWPFRSFSWRCTCTGSWGNGGRTCACPP